MTPLMQQMFKGTTGKLAKEVQLLSKEQPQIERKVQLAALFEGGGQQLLLASFC